jgi:arginyl-tRNA synthetase
VAQNNDNPVYYVQYAHARICRCCAWQEAGGAGVPALKDVDLSALEGPQAQALMLLLAKYPEMLTPPPRQCAARRDLLPARSGLQLPQLLRRRAHPGGRRKVKLARLALVAATAQVLHNGLAVLGVSAPERM